MAEEQRLRRKCNRYAKRLVLLGEDDIVWEAEPTPQNTSSNSDYTKCANEVFKYVTDNICDEGISKKVIKTILKMHFA